MSGTADHRVVTRTARQALGDLAEATVADQLVAAGWQVVARKLHVGRAEIDLLALDPGPPARIVAVEVRYRSARGWGLPEETVGWRKRSRLLAAILRLADGMRLPDGTRLPVLPVAVDLVAVEPPTRGQSEPLIRHHRDVAGG